VQISRALDLKQHKNPFFIPIPHPETKKEEYLAVKQSNSGLHHPNDETLIQKKREDTIRSETEDAMRCGN